MNTYIDPENKDEILDRLKRCPTLLDIYNLVKEVYPTWIVEFVINYSYDYPHLRYNWVQVAKEANIKPAQIMIVDYLGHSDDYTLIKHFAELYTLCGFLVRSKDEVEICDFCNLAIPNKEQWEQMIALDLNVPIVWSSTCSKCKKDK